MTPSERKDLQKYIDERNDWDKWIDDTSLTAARDMKWGCTLPAGIIALILLFIVIYTIIVI